MEYRIESDSIGSRQVPADAYYGVQSLRGSENFRITGQRLRAEFIESMAQIKKACAICNHAIGQLDKLMESRKNYRSERNNRGYYSKLWYF